MGATGLFYPDLYYRFAISSLSHRIAVDRKGAKTFSERWKEITTGC
ncbi:MAG: hypothetical protein AAGE99_04485 [Chlamydiota bacterium]